MRYKFFVVITFVFISSSFAQITVLTDSLFSPSINAYEKIMVVLPDGYNASQERYLTVYLLHGYGGDYTNWVKLTDLMSNLKDYHYIVVCPDAKNSWYTNSTGLKNANYEDLIMKDVIPFVDKKYRTKPTKFNRAIAGLSMGGYGAVKFGLKYPGQFFFAGGLSPAIQFPAGIEDTASFLLRSKESIKSITEMFGEKRNDSWKTNDVFDLLNSANQKTLPYFYLSVGSHDGIVEIIDLTHRFASALRKKDAAFELHEVPGEHSWKLWDNEIKIVLERIAEISGKKQ
ncbi:MAG: alpha/beta hydrolase [Bacteroidetes bacterium]|nr:alpha/beta hydrolase [Bacteroidota bacterium]